MEFVASKLATERRSRKKSSVLSAADALANGRRAARTRTCRYPRRRRRLNALRDRVYIPQALVVAPPGEQVDRVRAVPIDHRARAGVLVDVRAGVLVDVRVRVKRSDAIGVP
jgi:hypothetical protein